MECKPIPKPAYKSRNRKAIHDFSQKVRQAEHEDAKGICRICQCKPITQYHHANEKGMGGGRGLGIQINCIGVCDTCHDHSNLDFLRKSNEILLNRILVLFPDIREYTMEEVAATLRMKNDEATRQYIKGFLKATNGLKTCQLYIRQWLGVA
jgi:hypothetical protein